MKFKMNSKGINSYTSSLKKRIQYANSLLANEIKNNLELYSPKRTGKLASSYKLNTYPQSIQITNDCGYCKFVNYGTVKQTGQHFIERSIITSIESFKKKEHDIQNK